MNTYPNRTYLSLVVLLSACVFVSAGSVSFAPCKGTSSIKCTGPDAKGPDILEAFRHYNKTKITSLSFTNVKDMDDAAMKEILEIVASLQPSTITTLQLQTLPLIRSLPDSIGQLANLTTLTMTHLPLFESLPDSIGQLPNLKTLTMADLPLFESLPDSIGELAKLGTLTMTDIPVIKSLPDSIGRLASLKTLAMTDLSLFESLPDSFGELAKLETLTMTDIPVIKSLPDSIGQLASLKTLAMTDLSLIKSLPDSFGGLAKLETLTMTHLPLIESLPQSMSGLTELTTLTMTQMGGLKTLRTGSITIGSSKLIKLELHANQIEEIEADAIQVAPSGSLNRTIVNLSKNSLKAFNEGAFLPLIQRFSPRIFAYHNQVPCNCDLTWMLRDNYGLFVKTFYQSDCIQSNGKEMDLFYYRPDLLKNCQ